MTTFSYSYSMSSYSYTIYIIGLLKDNLVIV